MKLGELADISVGQIMTRVTDDMATDGNEVTVLTPKAVNDGFIDKESLKTSILVKDIEPSRYTRSEDVILKLSTPYDAVYIGAEDEHYVIPSFLTTIRITDPERLDAHYLVALMNSQYVRNQLQSIQTGSNRPMIRVSDLRELEIPDIPIEKMKAIGQEYELSCQKRQILTEMIQLEKEIMENTVLQSIEGGA